MMVSRLKITDKNRECPKKLEAVLFKSERFGEPSKEKEVTFGFYF